MYKNIDRAFGVLVRNKREYLGMSQAELSRKLGCPQPAISRLETGVHSASLRELVGLAQALDAPVSDLLAELENAGGVRPQVMKSQAQASLASFSAAFHAALADEEEALAQLAAYGVRFLGGPAGPAVFKLNLEETLLAALKHAHDPRIFEALPALVVEHCRSLDWAKPASGAFALPLQNRRRSTTSLLRQGSIARKSWGRSRNPVKR
ncbi:MAG: helix-turn-helix transcriptional regulator [Elusimicrobia bacterium]|nr:helix-turn-helix transcriptional regulator [Elusimicrobiota bacterium]